MKRIILAAIAALTFLGGCKTEDPGAPPVAGHESSSSGVHCETDDHCMPATDTADTTAGECVEGDDAAFYQCRGWKAAIYTNGTTKKCDFQINGSEKFALPFDELMCMTYAGPPDNETIYAACKQLAKDIEDWDLPTHPCGGAGCDAFTLDHIEYIFEDNSRNGMVGPGVSCDFYDSGKEWIPTSSTDNAGQQCLGGGCLPDAECPAIHEQSCAGWQPSTEITSSTNTTTHTITTTIDKAWLTTLAEDMFDSIVVCDSGTWTWSVSANPDKWQMQGLDSSDFMYRAGFRNGDQQIRVKKYGGSTWYNLYDTTMLGGYDKMATAFGALANETHFTLEIKRGSPLQVTYTMDLTLN